MVNNLKTSISFLFIFIGLLFLLMIIGPSVIAQKDKGKKIKNDKELSENERMRSEEYFSEGQKYYILEEYVKSLALFQKSLEIDPENATIYFKIAEVLIKNNELGRALPYANKAVELNPENKYFHLLKAEIYTKQANFQEAANVFHEIIEELPNTEEYYFDLAVLYLYLEKYDDALKTYDKLQEIFGVNEDVTFQKQKIFLKQNKLDAAINEGKILIENFPGESNYVLALSEILLSNNKHSDAEAYLKELLEVEPGNPSAQLMLFDVYRQSGKQELAEQILIPLFENPEVGIDAKLPLLLDLVKGIFDEKNKKLAIGLAERLEATHPNDANTFAIFGDINYALGDKTKARDKYLEAVKIDESNFNIWQNIIDIELQLGNYDQVLELADQAIELFPNQPTLYFFQGSANLIKKDYEEAVFALEQGKRLSTSNTELLNVFLSARRRI